MATPDDRAIQLGVLLRKRRKALGINMTAAADAAGMSRVTWHRLERGETGVAWGLMIAAAAALDLEVQLMDPHEKDPARLVPIKDALPLNIVLAEYPALRRMAWQIGEGIDAVTPREALGLYERNARHIDEPSLMPHEKALLRTLRAVFDGVPQ